MRHSYAFFCILFLAVLALTVSNGYAERPLAQAKPLTGTPVSIPVGSKIASTVPTCRLGVTGYPAFAMNYLYPPNDQYYILLDPATCGCEGSGVLLQTAHVMLEFADACSIPVTVGVVAADLSDPTCPVPMPGQYLCQPIQYTLAPESGGDFDFALSLNAACVTAKSFLVVTFLTLDSCGGVPSLIVDGGNCEPCVSWNYWPAGSTDLCGYLVGYPNMSVEAACCGMVGTTPETWGGIKKIYR